MIGATLNCRGVGKKGMSCFLVDFIRDQEVDFMGLQETIKKDYSPAFFRTIDPQNLFDWKWIGSIGRSGGILGGLGYPDSLSLILWLTDSSSKLI
jgi:hypothetical protein